jgi:hypothetical protein
MVPPSTPYRGGRGGGKSRVLRARNLGAAGGWGGAWRGVLRTYGMGVRAVYNRPSPAEARLRRYSTRYRGQDTRIFGISRFYSYSRFKYILIWEFDGTGLEKRACEAASQSDTWCTEGPRIVWTRLGSRPAKIRPRGLAGVLPEH